MAISLCSCSNRDEMLPSRQRSQHTHIPQNIAWLINRSLSNKSRMCKTSIAQETPKRLRPHRSIANMFVPVQLRSHRSLGVVAVPYLYSVKAYRLFDQSHCLDVAVLAHNVIPSNVHMTGVQTHRHRSASLQSVEQL